MHIYQPPVRGRANTIVPLGMLLSALVAFFGSGFSAMPLVLQMFGFGALACATALMVRYSLTTWQYVLTETPDGVVLSVERFSGKRKVVVAEARLADVVHFAVHQTRKERTKAVGRADASLDVRRNLATDPALLYDLVAEHAGKRYLLVLEAEASFVEFVERYLEEEKTAQAEK